MKAYIYSFEGKPWNEECMAVFSGFSKLGTECVLFATNEQLDQRKPEDVVVGGMLIMRHALNELGIEPPCFDYPDELIKYRGRNIHTAKIKDLKHEKLPVFIKPTEEKAAKGIIVNNWNDFSEYEHLDPETDIYCSDVVNFLSEWRCFVRYGKILGIQLYKGDITYPCDVRVIEEAIKNFKTIPAACSLDFGKTDDGRTLLIEMNDGYAIGCYGLDDTLYAKFLTSRWAELTRTKDPWKEI